MAGHTRAEGALHGLVMHAYARAVPRAVSARCWPMMCADMRMRFAMQKTTAAGTGTGVGVRHEQHHSTMRCLHHYP